MLALIATMLPRVLVAEELCKIKVRAIEGSEKAKSSSNTVSKEVKSFAPAPALNDVTPQLETLPFKKYQVLQQGEQAVKFNQQAVFKVSSPSNETQTVQVVPEMIEGSKVHITVDWMGPQGEKVLSTKVKVQNGRNVVLGADEKESNSTIICIGVNCGPTK